MIIVYVDNDNLQFTKYESVLTSLFVNKKSFFKIFTNEYDLSNLQNSLIEKGKILFQRVLVLFTKNITFIVAYKFCP